MESYYMKSYYMKSCGLDPVWLADNETAALLRAAWEADPDELTPQLALADWLDERNDPRGWWVRTGCELWAACRELAGHPHGWFRRVCETAIARAVVTPAGWRMAGLWGCLVGWHAPAGCGGVMGRTWADERVRSVSRWCWWWAVGLASPCQAAEAQRRANAAWRRAETGDDQEYTARYLASAAQWQAAATRCQAAAMHQAEAAVWSFARAAWDLCRRRLNDVR